MVFVSSHSGATGAAPLRNLAQKVSKELFSVRAPARDGVNHPLTAIHSTKEKETHMWRPRNLFMFALLLLFAAPVFAQGGGAAQGATNWVPIAAGLSMAIASGLCALGQGKATAAAAEAMARNPEARPGIQLTLILGLALIESLALYTLVIIFAKVV
jgi:F-type H+-transporting ATPase subunit c